MAAPDKSPPDSLILLRDTIAAQSPPTPSTSPDPSSTSETNVSLAQASYLIFNATPSLQDGEEQQHIAIPLRQATRFVSASTGKEVDLRSVYFCWQNKDTATPDYIAAVAALTEELRHAGKSEEERVVNLVFAEKLDLVTWLAGDVGLEESDYIRSLDANLTTAAQADSAAAAAKGGEDVEMRDAGLSDVAARKREEERLKEIYKAERKMGNHNTILRGVKIQDFGGVRKYSALFLGGGAKPNKPAAAVAPVLTSTPALRPPINPAAKSGRRPEPIILLSPSASSLLRMSNIKSFLSDGVYTAPDSTLTSSANILHLTRTLPSISGHGSQPTRFILVDSPDAFRPDYWSRVVAVFTTGQTWQFKNYKWQSPGELFEHVLGVYVGWRGEQVPETVRGWGRGVLRVEVEKGANRWRDREVVEDVWAGIEGRMRAQGWGR